MPRFNPRKTFLGIFIPDGVMEMDISTGAKFCFGLLLRYAGDNGHCWPKQSTLAERLKVSERQVRAYVAELEKAKLVDTERTGLGDSNRYYFLDDWMMLKTNDRKEASGQIGSDDDHRKETSGQIGTELPISQEGNFRSFHKTEENQQERESEKENQLLPPAGDLFQGHQLDAKNWREYTFEQFWSVVWLKIGRGDALTAWKKKIRGPGHADIVIQAAIRQGPMILASAMADGRSPLHPSRWLNSGRYDDDIGDLEKSLQLGTVDRRTVTTMSSISRAVAQLKKENGHA